ncbi:MAG: type II toxin-antitoxin system VapC family toxin [Chloroflexi bacterium]|nr:type II toxin-antitoxin system VapC family toxin [Chloroflexota bacterium]
MNYLLDTSSFLWFVNNDVKLSADAKVLLEDPGSDIHLSLASIWELAIKANLRRGLELRRPFPVFIDEELQTNRFRLLNINISHLKRIALLPLIHRDPFDRLLIAQSLAEDLPIITNDTVFDAYQVQRIW